jgi:predicted outer membrane repeat protein
VSGNAGGGIYTSGSVSLTNSTLSANSAATDGGAVASTGSLTASFSTVSTNSALKGGGIAMVVEHHKMVLARFIASQLARTPATRRYKRASALLREKQEEARRALAEIGQDSAWEQAQRDMDLADLLIARGAKADQAQQRRN